MSGARRPRRVGQVGVGVADQHAPAVDPVAQVADAAGGAQRAVRLDGECARPPTCATTCSAEVAGVDRDRRRAGEAERRRAGPARGRAAARCRPGTAPWAACSVSGRSRAPLARRPARTAQSVAHGRVGRSGLGVVGVRADAVVAEQPGGGDGQRGRSSSGCQAASAPRRRRPPAWSSTPAPTPRTPCRPSPRACTIAFGTAGRQVVAGQPDAGLLGQLAGGARDGALAAVQQAGRQRPAAAGRLAQQQQPARAGGLGVADEGHRADDVLAARRAGPAGARTRPGSR